MKHEEIIKAELRRLGKGSVIDFLADHSALINYILFIKESWHKTEPVGPFWMEYIEPLVVKIVMHSSTLENLLEGSTIEGHSNSPMKVLDMSSIYTIGRAQLEAYLTFFYLYIQPQDVDGRELRYYLFIVHSLRVRQTAKPELLPIELQEQYKLETEQIQEYQDRIRKIQYS